MLCAEFINVIPDPTDGLIDIVGVIVGVIVRVTLGVLVIVGVIDTVRVGVGVPKNA